MKIVRTKIGESVLVRTSKRIRPYLLDCDPSLIRCKQILEVSVGTRAELVWMKKRFRDSGLRVWEMTRGDDQPEGLELSPSALKSLYAHTLKINITDPEKFLSVVKEISKKGRKTFYRINSYRYRYVLK